MLRSHLTVAGCLAAALLSVTGCGSTETPETAPDQTGKVPPKPPAEHPGDGPGVVIAIDKLFLGETNRDGSPNKTNGWKQYGFNLDGKISTTESKDLCKPAAGAAPATIYPDGEQGIDNSFGKNILSIILGLEPAPSTAINESISEGSFTVMFDIQGLGSGTEYNPLTTRLYAGAELVDATGASMAPKWDGTDMWPVRPELLNDPTDITSSKVVFPQSYVIDNTWVSGTPGSVNLSLSVSGYALNLTISQATMSMDFDADHKGAVNGTIAGVLETEVLITELKKVVGGFQPSLCEGSTIEGILNQIRQASDIMKDGTQDPAQTCNGISIGLGFSGQAVQLGDIAAASEPQPDPCAPAPAGG
ncbi:MAG: hypothetical protein IT372_41575 [Polyangiaceae bacterium]|nr:hypothetical protein [Polyangiaceae bacterium]